MHEDGDGDDDNDDDADQNRFLSLRTTAYDCLVYIPWRSQKSKSLTRRLSRGLVQPKSTAYPVSTASPVSRTLRASASTVRASAADPSESGVGV